MVITILEACVDPEKWDALTDAYQTSREQVPSRLIRTFLTQSSADSSLWRIVSIWDSLGALDEARQSGEIFPGVPVFRCACAEPSLSIHHVVEHWDKNKD